jgi:hypothetical protein
MEMRGVRSREQGAMGRAAESSSPSYSNSSSGTWTAGMMEWWKMQPESTGYAERKPVPL